MDADFVTFNDYKSIGEIIEGLRENSLFLQENLNEQGGSVDGWSKISSFQRCPRSYKYRYIKEPNTPYSKSDDKLDVGILVHALLCLYYKKKDWTILLEAVRENAFADQKVVDESERLMVAYLDRYATDTLNPVVVESVAQIEGYSCRYDLIAEYKPDGYPKGLWNLDHKTTSRFSGLAKYQMHGEIMGQTRLWELSGNAAKYGPLQGSIINLIGRQKIPKFERIVVPYDSFLLDEHMKDIEIWRKRISLSVMNDDFPKSTSNCNSEFGLCNFFDICRYGDK